MGIPNRALWLFHVDFLVATITSPVLPGSCLITAWKVNQPKPVFAEGEEEEETDEK